MYKILGWINLTVTFALLSPFALMKITNKKDGVLSSIAKFLRKLHKPLGGIILILIAIHGTLALGALTLHTGTLAGITYIIVASFGGLFVIMKKKGLFNLHRAAAVLFVLLLAMHLVLPSLLG